MATLKKRNGNYSVRFVKTINGIRQEAQISLETRSKKVADKLKRRLETEYEVGDINVFENFNFRSWKDFGESASNTNLLLTDVVEKFLEGKVEINEQTHKNYRYLLRNFNRSVGKTMFFHLVAKSDVIDFAFNDKLSVASQNNYLRHLKVFFSWAEKNGYGENITAGFKKKTVPETLKDQIISEEQLRMIIEAHSKYILEQKKEKHIHTDKQAQKWFAPMMKFAFFSGFRLSEVLNLKWKDIKLAENQITITGKGGKSRTMIILKPLQTVLKQWKESVNSQRTRYVFESAKSRTDKSIRMTNGTASKVFKKNVLRTPLDDSIHFHSLRHSCATHCLKKGFGVYEVQRMLGHSSITITEKYLHLIPADLKAKALKIGLI